ncbi:tetratricopeptide repeat protein 31-like [Epinephelus moara]|uniref:tetratricopeptide repeat protein 31-like n=1 Tax=Epinephelus moara TaxID=300413 RepID=UPI00214E37B4|nr:tetratricopeptide repeat protein 31-like [Epinephelus moara]
MDIYRDETEFTDIHMVQNVADLFESRPGFQKIVRLGLIANMDYNGELDITGKDDYGADGWAHGRNNFHGYSRLSDRSSDRGLGGSRSRQSASVYQLPLHYYASSREVPLPPSVKAPAKESDSERRARLLEEVKKSKEKAEKKRLKKQKRKERKRLEKLEKEKQNPNRNDEEEKDDAQQSKAEESKPVNESKTNSSPSVKQSPSAKDSDSSDSSEDESSDEDSDTKNDSGDSEELDMTSTFVSKAALIARRKLEQKPRPERKEKKKSPIKEEPKTVSDKPNEDTEAEKKSEQDSAAPSSHAVEDNIKISTDLAVIGNKFASAGDFNMAVKYFTDAIKYNPTEFKLFGNRSFCFEKMQEYEKALTDAELSLSMCPGWVKGLFRRGRALAGLKRYVEAAQAFKEVLKLDSSCAEAAQELMRVQITQLMEYGFTREQSSNALIIHGTVEKAIEVLSKLNHRSGAIQNGPLQPAQVANVTGVSPVLSANTVPPHPHLPHPHQPMDAPKTVFKNKPLGPVQNMSNVQSKPKPTLDQATKTNNEGSNPPQELFPVWVGNLFHPVTESMITNVFNKVGFVYSVKLLIYRRCAFVNFTKQEHCDEAIRRFHGYELNGMKIAVRYPDRIPSGMGISRAALKADDLQDENMRHNEYAGSRRPFRPYRHVPDFGGNDKY